MKRLSALGSLLTVLFLLLHIFPERVLFSPVFAKGSDAPNMTVSRPPPSLLPAAAQGQPYPLTPGETRSSVIAGGQKHTYLITLSAGELARVLIEQLGVDLTVTSYRPDGQRLFEFNGAPWPRQTEAISISAEAPGGYRLEVNLPDKLAAPGSYEIRLEYIRIPTPADSKLAAAEQAFTEAVKEQQQSAPEAKQQSALKYERAAELWREGGDARGEAKALHALANLYRDSRGLSKSERYFERTLTLWRELQDRHGEAYTLMGLGDAVRDLRSAEGALVHYQKALEIFRDTQNRLGEAASLHSIGLAYALVGDMRKALEHYQQALPLRQAEKDRRGELSTLNAMSGAYDGLGEPAMSLKLAEEVAQVWRAAGEPVREAIALNNAALIYDEWGDWQKALDYYGQALARLPTFESLRAENCRSTAVTDRCRLEAAVLDNMGALYAALGEPARALELHERSLVIRRDVGQPRGIGTTLARIGYAHLLSGEPQQALNKYSEALPILQRISDKRNQAYTLTVMGMAYVSQREYPKALDLYKQALALQEELQDIQGQAITLDKMGQAQSLTGEPAAAFKTFGQALALWRRVSDPHGEAITLYNLASAERDHGRIPGALASLEKAIANVEALRTVITSQKLRTSYFSSKQDYYGLLIDLRMRLHAGDPSAGHDAAALEASERARARGLIDTLAEAQVNLRQGVNDPELIQLEADLRQRLSSKVAAARRLTAPGGGQVRERLADALGKEIDELSSRYDEVRARIRSRSPRYAELTQPRPLSASEIQRLLDDDTLLLEYSLGDERSYLWTVNKAGSISSHVLPPRSKIEAAAAQLLKLLTAPEPEAGITPEQHRTRVAEAKSRYLQESAALSEMVLGPAADRLGKKRLLIVGDGALQYVPFVALPIPAGAANFKTQPPSPSQTPGAVAEIEPLVANHEVVELPSASTLATLRAVAEKRRAARRQVAVLADPVFTANDLRIPRPKPGGPVTPTARASTPADRLRRAMRDGSLPDDDISRLPFTQLEADAIMSVIPKTEGMAATGFEASYETATGGQLAHYRVVHFATHGLLDGEHPELSGLVLSLYDRQGRPKKYGFLRLPDIYNLNLPAELVVLSACRTALGKQIRGEGLVGLTRGFMYAGSPRVVASLWRVDDEATAELMKTFYRHMFKGRMTPAAALRAAQQDIRRQKRWSYPYYWAAFVLQGEWK